MKPRLTLRHGIWACFTWSPRAIGCGYTLRHAYNEWRASLAAQQVNAA